MNLSQYSDFSVSITVKDPEAAMKFYSEAFGAVEDFRLVLPGGMIAHMEFSIGDSHIMLSGESPDWKAFAIPEGQFAPCLFRIKTQDAAAAYEKALTAGAGSIEVPIAQPWNIRSAVVSDPFGYRWVLAESLGEMRPEDIQAQLDQMA